MSIDKGDPRNTGLKAHFHRLKPPEQRFEDVVLGRGTEEKAADIQLEEEDAPMEVEEDLSDVQQIQRRVFTGSKPEFIKLTGPDNFVDCAKRLGIFDKIMKRQDIETALVKYWIDQLGGDKTCIFHRQCFSKPPRILTGSARNMQAPNEREHLQRQPRVRMRRL